MPREFTFDPVTQRYRVSTGAGKGQFISAEAVVSLTSSYLEQVKERIADATDRLISQSISPAEWERTMAQIIKEGHVNAFTLGKGGMAQISSQDLGIMGSRIKSEYKYLRGFTRSIQAGELTEAQIRSRSKQYADAIFATRSQSSGRAHTENGFLWERDIIHAVESCGDCIAIAARGWVKIGTNPPIGTRACKSGCRCSKRYSRESDRPADWLMAQGWGWVGYSVRYQIENNLKVTNG